MRRALPIPLFVALVGISAVAMLVPAVHAAAIGDWRTGRVFVYSAALVLMLTSLLAVATWGHRSARPLRGHLLTLFAAFFVLPVFLAFPVHELMPWLAYRDAWFEMVSSVTTTGATLLDVPAEVPPSIHLWRALVGWLGGFLIWVAAVAILAPANLGGYEVLMISGTPGGRRQPSMPGEGEADRLLRHARELLPVYAAITAVLWFAQVIVGETSFVAFCHALSTVSTSGISPVGGLENGAAGQLAPLAIVVGLVFALSRVTFSRWTPPGGESRALADPELRMGAAIVLVVTCLLFLRHWAGTIDDELRSGPLEAARALWGIFFTTLSFLTTAGFTISDWEGAQVWSGLHTPGLVLAGLALVGGGAGTTAGGVKLLRVYALLRHGERELERLVYPSLVAGGGPLQRQMRRGGAFNAWVFFMLFIVSVAVLMLALSLFGIAFEPALVLTTAALSNTGPVAAAAATEPVAYSSLSDGVKFVLAAAMTLGRLETLALVALFNPDLWRS